MNLPRRTTTCCGARPFGRARADSACRPNACGGANGADPFDRGAPRLKRAFSDAAYGTNAMYNSALGPQIARAMDDLSGNRLRPIAARTL
jgi:hypothetical protein